MDPATFEFFATVAREYGLPFALVLGGFLALFWGKLVTEREYKGLDNTWRERYDQLNNTWKERWNEREAENKRLLDLATENARLAAQSATLAEDLLVTRAGPRRRSP